VSKWDDYKFEEVILDDTKNGTKIKKENYLEQGSHPVIDQGQHQIAGYTNTGDGLYNNIPAIIFGDHTRIIKYIDTPFFLGADGVKLLKSKKDNASYKYLYYFFLKNEVTNTGYNRHFKWLKELVIPLPPLEIQKQIAKTLDTTAELLAMRKQQLAELDNLIKSTFYDMFGDPVTNSMGWSFVKLGDAGELKSGGTPTRSNPNYFLGDIDWYSAGELNRRYLIQSNEKLTIEAMTNSAAKVFRTGSMLIGMYDTAAFKLGILTKDSSSNQACANIDVDKNLANIIWLYDCFQIMRPFFLKNRRGVRQKNLTLGMIKSFEIPLPPLLLQTQFASIVTKIEEQKALVNKAIDETQYLFDSLMSEYFE